MLKKFFLFLAAASMIVACSDEFDDSALRGELDDLGGKVENLEQQIAQLQQAAASINAELATISAIANGVAITKVEPVEGGFKITFSDGKSYTITNGAKGDKGDKGDKGEQGATPTNPIMRIDSDGYWQVSYDGGTTWEYPNGEKISALGAKGEQGAQGAAGATPQIGVDAEGYWTVSYDGGTTFTRLKDANGNEVKAVVSGGSSATPDSNFASVKLSDDGTMLEIVLAGETDPIRVPVGGKALVVVKSGDAAIEGVQLFQNGEKKEYTIEAAAQYMKLIGYPEGWEAVLAEKKLTVTAPAAAPAASRATADTASDISILAVLENGMAVIARVQVAIGVAEPEPEPTAGFVWDAAVWGPLFETNGGGDKNANYDFGNGLQYIAGGAKIRLAADHIQPRATGIPAENKGLLQLTVGGPGQLVIDISSNNDTGEKDIAIMLGENEIARKTAHFATTVGRTVYTIDCSAAKANDVITVYSTNGAYMLFVMKWIPGEGGSTPEPTPTALATPVVTLDPASVEAGAEKEVAVAWAAVENAASYDVVFNGAAPVNVTTNAYKLDAATVKALAKGEYKVSVVAKPAADATAFTQSAAGEATLTVTEAAAPAPTETKVYKLIASEVTADQLGIPGNKAGLQGANGAANTWTLNEVTFESFMVRSTTKDSAENSTPVFYFYKAETAGQTYLKNTSKLGEIVSIKMMLIDSGKKKGNVFTMVEKVNGVEQTVLSSNDNTDAEEHIYTFSAGNDGTFCFKGGDQDGKVLSFEITYKQ